MAEIATVYVLSPQRGRVGRSRQVPNVSIPSEQIENSANGALVEAIERAFFKYHSHDVYAGLVDLAGGLFGVTHLYCANTNNKIATITITKEYAT